jgi:hypothetical protein
VIGIHTGRTQREMLTSVTSIYSSNTHTNISPTIRVSSAMFCQEAIEILLSVVVVNSDSISAHKERDDDDDVNNKQTYK